MSYHALFSRLLFFFFWGGPVCALATPTLLTFCEIEGEQVQTWWPNAYGADSAWISAFEKQGVSLIHPATLADAPRLSPMVYSAKPLSDANARTLGSLFGTQNVLNGIVTWHCTSLETTVSCAADVSLRLLYGKQDALDWNERLEAEALSPEMAKKYIATRLVSHLALSVVSATKTRDEIPALTSNPVILFDPIPDADTLVTLRKMLKQVNGVEDVAERWVSDGVLAIELNPANPTMSQSEFLQIVQAFSQMSSENLVVREMRSSDRGVIFEVVKY